MKQGVTRFFKYARLRHEAYLAKQRGVPKGEQSKDPILNQFSFTNVFRELDKTTKWFADHVREPLRDKPEVLLATVLFRLLNRIEVGEAIFLQTMIAPSSRKMKKHRTAWEMFVLTGDVSIIKHAVITSLPKPPYCTGAYIISSPQGFSKLDGVLDVIRRFYHGSKEWEGLGAGILDTMNWQGEEGAVAYMLANRGEVTLEATWEWLKQFDYFGPFHSYEIVTDLRFTALLDKAPDIMTWANPGPGALRGLNRVHGRAVRGGDVLSTDHSASRSQMIEEMRELLKTSRSQLAWPQMGDVHNFPGLTAPTSKSWPTWEMRDVEHTLCEFDKYERTRLGHGRPRGVYR